MAGACYRADSGRTVFIIPHVPRFTVPSLQGTLRHAVNSDTFLLGPDELVHFPVMRHLVGSAAPGRAEPKRHRDEKHDTQDHQSSFAATNGVLIG